MRKRGRESNKQATERPRHSLLFPDFAGDIASLLHSLLATHTDPGPMWDNTQDCEYHHVSILGAGYHTGKMSFGTNIFK